MRRFNRRTGVSRNPVPRNTPEDVPLGPTGTLGHVVLSDANEPAGGARNWGTAFMPATYQGTYFRGGPSPILHLAPPADAISKRNHSASIITMDQVRPASAVPKHAKKQETLGAGSE